MSLWAAFITGIVAGGVSCAAVQGGLLAAMSARRVQTAGAAGSTAMMRPPVTTYRTGKGTTVTKHKGPTRPAVRVETIQPKDDTPWWRNDLAPVSWFLAGKFVSHTLLGALLGWVGTAMQLGSDVRGYLQVATALLLVLFALDLLGVGILRRVMPSTPVWVARFVRRAGRWESAMAPGSLGVLVFLIPCGVTLSMEFQAIASGSPVRGAAIMATFVGGTVPLFVAVGVVARRAGRSTTHFRQRLIGWAIVAAAVVSLNSGLLLLGSPVTPIGLWHGFVGVTKPAAASVGPDGVQRITVNAGGGGYDPSSIQLKSGMPAKIAFHSAGPGCTNVTIFPGLDKQFYLDTASDKELNVDTSSPKTIEWVCGMGMYSGSVEVLK